MVTLSGTPPLTADQMADLHDNALAMQVVLSGVFDDRIADLKQIQADVTVKQEALIALDEANSVRAVADKYAITVKAQADAIFDQANKTFADANNRAGEVASQQKDIDAQTAKLKAAQADFAERQNADRATLQKDRDRAAAAIRAATDELEVQQLALKEGQDNLTEAQIQLSQEQAEVATLKAQLQSKLEAFAKVDKQ